MLAQAVNKLESFSSNRRFSEEQTKKMFKVMSLGTNQKSLPSFKIQYANCALAQLMFHDDDVDAEVLARALNNLKSLKMKIVFGNLTLPQIIAFFKQLNSQTKLDTIWSDGNRINV